MLTDKETILDQAIDLIGGNVFAKDKSGRYLYCNENLARAANLDSPSSIVGKYDTQLIWREQSTIYRWGDIRTLSGESFVKVPELQVQADSLKKVVTSKNILRDSEGKVRGVAGFYIEENAASLISAKLREKEEGYTYDGPWDSIFFTKQEILILRCLSLGWTINRIRKHLNLSLDGYKSLKTILVSKLGCNSSDQIYLYLIQSGLTHALF